MTGRPRRIGRAGLFGLALVSAAALAGCGVSTGGPSAIPKDQVPFDLLAVNPPTTTSTTQPAPNSLTSFDAYLANAEGQLVAKPRFISVHASLKDALNQNLFQPSVSAAESGLITYLGTVRLLDATASGPSNNELVTINLNASFDELSGSALVLAVGQLVLTATSYQNPASISVQFEVEGSPVDVPTGSGSQFFAPVNWEQYLSLVAPATGTAAP